MNRANLRNALFIAVSSLFTVLVIAGAFFLVPVVGEWGVILGAVASVGLLIVCLLPRDLLPAVALAVYLFVPRRLLSMSEITDTVTPSLVIITIWAIRSFTSGRTTTVVTKPSPALKSLIILFLMWLIFGMVINRPQLSSLAWTADFIFLVLLPLIVPNAHRAIRPLQNAMLGSSVLMLALCALEFSLQSNIFLDPIYSAAGLPDVQHWSVYRAAGTLGHPLYAGLFFATSFAIAFGRRFEVRDNRYLFIAGLNMIGVLLTVSRSSLGALAAGAAAIGLIALFRRSSFSLGGKLGIAILFVIITFMLTQTAVFQDRFSSAEAQGSTFARNYIVDISLRAAAGNDWIGSGAATSLLAAGPHNPTGVIIENAYLQTLISLGIPGVVLLVCLFMGGALTAARTGQFAALGGLVVYAFSIGFFNIFESSNPSLILAGSLLLMTWRGDKDPNHESARSQRDWSKAITQAEASL